jgi:hypothetical protein
MAYTLFHLEVAEMVKNVCLNCSYESNFKFAYFTESRYCRRFNFRTPPLKVSESRCKLMMKSAKYCQSQRLCETRLLGTSCFWKLFHDCSSGSLNPLNQ